MAARLVELTYTVPKAAMALRVVPAAVVQATPTLAVVCVGQRVQGEDHGLYVDPCNSESTKVCGVEPRGYTCENGAPLTIYLSTVRFVYEEYSVAKS